MAFHLLKLFQDLRKERYLRHDCLTDRFDQGAIFRSQMLPFAKKGSKVVLSKALEETDVYNSRKTIFNISHLMVCDFSPAKEESLHGSQFRFQFFNIWFFILIRLKCSYCGRQILKCSSDISYQTCDVFVHLLDSIFQCFLFSTEKIWRDKSPKKKKKFILNRHVLIDELFNHSPVQVTKCVDSTRK